MVLLLICFMFKLEKSFRFEASHQLHHHDGKCKRLHGHSWNMSVEIQADSLQADGPQKNMVMDFYDISKAVKPLLENYLDHYHLNDTLKTDSPTTEFIARWVYDKLKPELPGIAAVTVHETCTSLCRYEGE